MVVETLRGKGAAIAAMVIGVLTLVMLPFSASAIPAQGALLSCLRNADLRGQTLFWLGIFGGLWLGEATVLVLVANNTWRKTILEARDGTLSLTFQSPLSTHVLRWPFEQILELSVDRAFEVWFIDPRLELLLRAHGGQLIRLFTDHKETELESIAAALKEMMGWSVAPAGAAETARSPTGLPD